LKTKESHNESFFVVVNDSTEAHEWNVLSCGSFESEGSSDHLKSQLKITNGNIILALTPPHPVRHKLLPSKPTHINDRMTKALNAKKNVFALSLDVKGHISFPQQT
jgi:hypothetical protein